MSMSREQLIAARKLLGWSQMDLACKAGVSQTTIGAFERDARRPQLPYVSALKSALEDGGVEFTEGRAGVRLAWPRNALRVAQT
jgi:transcriptional regulator with XRE-family HTH domain